MKSSISVDFIEKVYREEIELKYLNKRIPDEYRKKGMASPTIYTF